MNQKELEKNQRFWWLVLFIPLAVALIWLLIGVFSFLLGFNSSVAWAVALSDNFDAYNLGNLDGQGSWTSTGWQVVNNLSQTPSQSISDTGGYMSAEKSFSGTETTGEFQFYFLISSANSSVHTIWIFDEPYYSYPVIFYFQCPAGICGVYYVITGNLASENFVVDVNSWNKISVGWENGQMRIKFDDEEWGEFQTPTITTPPFDYPVLFRPCDYGAPYNLPLYIDSIGETIPPELVPRVWGIDPVSETEIIDLEDIFEFGWEDLDDWDTLSVVFQNRDTGIFTEAQELLITTSPSGSMIFNFSDFNPDRNGKFYFFAISTRSVPEVIEGMYLTGRYSYEWSDDLVDPEYWLNFNIGGITPVFEMSDFSDYYGSIAKFTTPTDMAIAITGFFEPIFSKLGEFGNRIIDYFNVNEAYAQGYEIGKSIPYFTYFVGQISLFLGGFPIMKWLFVLVLLLTGIFIFRLIMKFIPFLG